MPDSVGVVAANGNYKEYKNVTGAAVQPNAVLQLTYEENGELVSMSYSPVGWLSAKYKEGKK